MDMTDKRKAGEDQQEQPEKKSRSEQEERGVKRSTEVFGDARHGSEGWRRERSVGEQVGEGRG